MNCPHCGAEGYEKEAGCRVCLYLEDTQIDPAAGEEMALPELNRMLEAMGVQPLTDVERASNPPKEEDSDIEPEIPFSEAADNLQDTSLQSEQELLQTQPVAEGDKKKRLAAARYSAGWLSVVRQVFSDILHQVARFARKSGTVHKDTSPPDMSDALTTPDESESMEEATKTEEQSLEPELWMEAMEADLPLASSQPEPVPETDLSPDNALLPEQLTTVRRKWLFWVGVPVLIVILTISVFFLVLSLRRERMEPDEPASSNLPGMYMPWTPEAETIPDWSVTIKEE